MTWYNLRVIFECAINCPFFWWAVIALGITAIFITDDPKLRKE